MKSQHPNLSSERMSLENAKTKTWHPGWIILILVVLTGIVTYSTVRVLRKSVVTPVTEATKTVDIMPD